MKTTNPFIASVSDQSGEMVELIPQDSQTLTADEKTIAVLKARIIRLEAEVNRLTDKGCVYKAVLSDIAAPFDKFDHYSQAQRFEAVQKLSRAAINQGQG